MNLITAGHIKRGFSIAYSRINDVKIDVPNAELILSEIQKKAASASILPPGFIPVLSQEK